MEWLSGDPVTKGTSKILSNCRKDVPVSWTKKWDTPSWPLFKDLNILLFDERLGYSRNDLFIRPSTISANNNIRAMLRSNGKIFKANYLIIARNRMITRKPKQTKQIEIHLSQITNHKSRPFELVQVNMSFLRGLLTQICFEVCKMHSAIQQIWQWITTKKKSTSYML